MYTLNLETSRSQ